VSAACLLASSDRYRCSPRAQAQVLYDFEVALAHVDRGIQETLALRREKFK
jgi:hypothetical protein